MRQRLLVLSHGHPRFNRGGGEYAAYAIHHHLGAQEDVESLFLAAGPADVSVQNPSLVCLEGGREWLIPPTDDWLLFEGCVDLRPGCELQQLLERWKPDLIHVHHFYRLGLDVLFALQRWFPQSRWIVTLHEFLAICPYQGQLLRRDGTLCSGPSAKECSRCLPQIAPVDFALREALMRLLLERMDVLIAPSEQLAQRYVAWGIDPSRIQVVECPLSDAVLEQLPMVESPLQAQLRQRRDPCRFGFFGNVQPPKGLDLVLLAMQQVVRQCPDAMLTIFGLIPENLEGYPPEQQRNLLRVRELVEQLGPHCELIGGYSQEDIPSLMQRIDWVVMGSRWLENSPVVIQEARACRRPLLVPRLGGMAEKVKDGEDGFHFTSGDADALAALMIRCGRSRPAWNDLVKSMRPPEPLEAIIAAHRCAYGLSL